MVPSTSFRAFVICSLLLFPLVACENDLEAVRRMIKPEELTTELMKDVEILYSDSAILRVQVKGPLLVRHVAENPPFDEFPAGVDVHFFDPGGQKQSRLTANYAMRYEGKNQIIVRDSVVWQSEKDEMLETEELIWDEKKQKVYTKKFVTITNPDEIIYGYGFEADQDFKRWEINAVEGKIKVEQ